MNYLVRLAFDGTNYHGFQVQKNALTVCEVFQDALQAVLGVRPDVKGCSRTDAGVHALDFALNFCAETHIPPEKLPLALNMHLPPDVRVNSCCPVPPDFHARYSAHSKTYVYRIRNSAVDSPFEARYSYRVPGQLDEAAMDEAAQLFCGRQDFASFCAAGSEVAARGGTVRTVYACGVQRRDEDLTITVTADGYLYNMVRILAGTLVEIGAHRRPPQSMTETLHAAARAAAGPTLPPRGLFLAAVHYPANE